MTAVAPGFLHTEFHDRMNVSKDGVPAFLGLDASTLVRLALRDVARGRAVSIPTLRYKIVVALAGLLPKRIVATGALRGRRRGFCAVWTCHQSWGLRACRQSGAVCRCST